MTRIYASEDTYAISDADSPHGNSSVLAVIDNATHTAYTYIKFDLSAWAGKTLDPESGGLLKLYIVSNELPAGSYTRIRFRRITGTWNEDTLKWTNKPDTTTHNDKSKQIYSTASGWESYNITDLLQDIIDGEGCCGVYVAVDEHVVWFSSSNGDDSPKLYLTEATPLGDIHTCETNPTSQEEGEYVWVDTDVENIGYAAGVFTLKYYEGAVHLKDVALGTINPGNTGSSHVLFTMPDHDYTITVKAYNNTTGNIDDTCSVTCYIIGGTEYYVKTDGNDELPGSSWANAWKTIDKAARTVPDGSTVHIGFGNYNSEPAGNKIAPQNVGASGIYYQPETAGSEGGIGTVSIEKNA